MVLVADLFESNEMSKWYLAQPISKLWLKLLQEKINKLASPRVGMERLAIALGFFRDYLKYPGSRRVTELQGCLDQLEKMYYTFDIDGDEHAK